MKTKTGRILPLTLKSLLSKPATVAYPANRENIVTELRGRLTHDIELCVGCTACMRDCPAGAIEIEKIADKRYKAIYHMDRCIFCAQCVDSCPKDALQCTNDFELAALDRTGMTFEM